MGVLAYMPPELVQYLLTFCHPWDVAAFSRTSRRARDLVYGEDLYIWRELFLSLFDDPRRTLHVASDFSDWKNELTRRMKAELVACRRDDNHTHLHDRISSLKTFLSVVRDSLPLIFPEVQPSKSLYWLDDVIRRSDILSITPSEQEVAMISQLRCYRPLGAIEEVSSWARLTSRRTKSRCYVYDLDNYTPENRWGPFLPNGKVNWPHVECIIDVILTNLRESPAFWTIARPPLSLLDGVRPYSAPGRHNPDDWAKVEGTWRRYVCFMDYRDLFAFNFSGMGFGIKDPALFEEPSFREATKLLEITLQLTTLDKMATRHHARNSSVDLYCNPYFPTLHFTGTSKGENGVVSVLEGTIKMDLDDTVRWQFVSLNDGQIQWGSQGIQVGNIGSATGVVGSWTTVTHEEGDPVGPFWLWKVDDSFTSQDMRP